MPAKNFHADEYFMSQEAEDAAKYRIYQEYKAIKAKHATLLHEAATVGAKLQELGTLLRLDPACLSAPDPRVISKGHRSDDPARVFCEEREIGFPKIVSLLREIEKVSFELDSLRERVRAIGMSE